MDSNTDELLFRGSPEQEVLDIHDVMVAEGDISAIVAKLPAFPKLKSLNFVGTTFTSKMIFNLFEGCAKIPGLENIVIADNGVTLIDNKLAINGWKLMSELDVRIVIAIADFYPNLQSLSLTACESTQETIAIRPGSRSERALLAHPTNGVIDLSGSKLGIEHFVGCCVGKNKRIHTLRLGEIRDATRESYAELLGHVMKSNVASLALPYDPWSTSRYAPEYIESWLSNSRNLIEFSVAGLEAITDDDRTAKKRARDRKQGVIRDACARNMAQAEHFLGRLESARIITQGDVDGINQRLSAIICLGDRKYGHQESLRLLQDFHDRAATEFNLELKTSPFLDQDKVKALRVQQAKAAEKSLNSASLDAVVAQLTESRELDIEQQVKAQKNSPAALRQVGETIMGVATQLVVPALREMSSAPTLQEPITLFGQFLAKLDQARLVLEAAGESPIGNDFAQAQQEVSARGLPQIPMKKGWFPFTQTPQTLSDTKDIVAASGNVLQDMRQKTQEVETCTDNQLSTADKLNMLHIKIDNQFAITIKAIKKVLGEWRDEWAVESAAASPQMAPSEPSYIQTLNTRLTFLEDTRALFQRNHSGYIIHQDFIQKFQQQLSLFADQSLPVLAGTVDTLHHHLERSFPNPDSERGVDRRNTNLCLAVQEMTAIYSFAEQINESLHALSDQASELSAHIGQMFPSRPMARPTPARTSVPESAGR